MIITITQRIPAVNKEKTGAPNAENFDLLKQEFANCSKCVSNINSNPSSEAVGHLASFFEEVAMELRCLDIDTCYMMTLIAEVNKAMVGTYDELEAKEDMDYAS